MTRRGRSPPHLIKTYMENQKELSTEPIESLVSQEHGSLVGRELDAAVAERVMGAECDCEGGPRNPLNPHGIEAFCPVHGNTPQGSVPFYSTDIAAAMQVVQQVIMKGFTFEMRWIAVWMARFDSLETGRHFGFTAEWPDTSAAEVICRAALAAIKARE